MVHNVSTILFSILAVKPRLYQKEGRLLLSWALRELNLRNIVLFVTIDQQELLFVWRVYKHQSPYLRSFVSQVKLYIYAGLSAPVKVEETESFCVDLSKNLVLFWFPAYAVAKLCIVVVLLSKNFKVFSTHLVAKTSDKMLTSSHNTL